MNGSLPMRLARSTSLATNHSFCLVSFSISIHLEINHVVLIWGFLFAALSKIKSNDLVWYFFSPKESTKKATRRVTRSGFWKKTGRSMNINNKGGNCGEIGLKMTLVYIDDKVRKSDWLMYEYHITCLPPDQVASA